MELSRVDLNLLVAFDALMAERNVTRAAERLSVGQSAMSATLGRIRKLFGDPILVRQGRELVATPFAESLVEPVREALADIAVLLESRSQQFDPRHDARTFTIAASEYTTLIFLHEMLIRLTNEAPNVRLHIEPLDEDFAERLRSNEIDLLLIPQEAFPGHIEYPHSLLFSDRFVCAVAVDNPDVGERLTVEQFSTMPYLSTRFVGRPSLAEEQLDEIGISRHNELTTSMTMAPFLVRGTRLVTLIYEKLGRLVADEVELRLLEPPMELAPVHETMVWTQRHDSDPAHQWLRTRMHDLVGELTESRRRRRGAPHQ